jgi:hypothetical protein
MLPQPFIAVAHPPGNFFLIMSMPRLSMSRCGTETFGASLPMIFLFPACRLVEEGPPRHCRSALQGLRQRGAAGL